MLHIRVNIVVLVDRKYCIGCRYCIQACPYGARYIHPVLKVVDKCILCYHRITNGLLPACVGSMSCKSKNFSEILKTKTVKLINL